MAGGEQECGWKVVMASGWPNALDYAGGFTPSLHHLVMSQLSPVRYPNSTVFA